MAQEQMPHKLTLSQRNNLTITGVTEVVSFDDRAVLLRTVLGTLMVQGQNLQLKQLSLDGGNVAVDGEIAALMYEDKGTAQGFWGRLFG